ncbi:MAG: hypothetical protein OER88_00150, partial [Planctomycetota bacterium]|nr:hypothetical protein [Planctomycetota bacterium]
ALTTGYLKQEFAARQRDILGEAQLIRPRNFAEAGASPVLEARIIAKEMITACDIYVNSSEDAVAIEWPENQFSDQATQREGSVFVLRIPAVQIQLDKPKNRVVVEFRVAGRVTSRTFILFRKAAAQK